MKFWDIIWHLSFGVQVNIPEPHSEGGDSLDTDAGT